MRRLIPNTPILSRPRRRSRFGKARPDGTPGDATVPEPAAPTAATPAQAPAPTAAPKAPPRRWRRGGYPLARSATRGSMVFLVAGVVGMGYLAARTPALAGLIEAMPASVAKVAAEAMGRAPHDQGLPGHDQTPAGSGSDAMATPSGSGTGPETAGDGQRTASRLAPDSLKLLHITVTGRKRTDARDVLDAVGAPQGSPLMDIDPATVRARLEALPWVSEALVERRLPDRLHISLTERSPLALWQHDGRFMVVDAAGGVIDVDPGAYADLPLVVGANAADHAQGLLSMLATQPALAARVKASTLVGGRRWTLRLDDIASGIDVRLPQEDPHRAWTRLARLEAEQGILEKDLRLIDLRLPSRVVVRLAEPATEENGADMGSSGQRVKETAPRQGTTPAVVAPRKEGRDA